jgi:hypothetical protein
MLDKSIAVGLMGLVATISTVDIAENSERILNDTTAIAVVLQEHEVATALELYYLKVGRYPLVSDEAVIAELYAQDVMRENKVQYSVEYSTSRNGQRYELSVS